MSALRPVEIVGGGLAGLALGLGLRHAGIPVSVFEAGGYPRHRVCGEFITGLRKESAEKLGLSPLLQDARLKSAVAWYFRERPVWHQRLPEPALALSRHALDIRLAEAFVARGGNLFTEHRVDPQPAPVGRVFAMGRRRSRSPWLGLKLHLQDLSLTSELEFHLGRHAYVGLCEVESGRVNVCGLFRQRPGVAGNRTTLLGAYLRASGLNGLADRLAAALPCPESHCAVAGISFALPRVSRHRVELGDTFAMIPPFTGNGMAMAFESAAIALGPLLSWSRGEAAWPFTVSAINRQLQRDFRLRLRSAAVVHPLLLSPRSQPWVTAAARAGCLPWRSLYRALH